MQIQTINTIELSSKCDNQCPYCPAPIQHKYRKTGFMEWNVYEQAIKNVLMLARRGTQKELNLFGVGESTLHPDIIELVKYARKTLPFAQDLHLNTNGNTMTFDLAKSLKDAGITAIDITGHDHLATAKTIRYFRQLRIKHMISYDFAVTPNNWAGQVDWFEPDEWYPKTLCPWLSRGQIMVMSDGNITTCCIDAFGQGVFGTVFDKLDSLQINEQELCKKCHHLTPSKIAQPTVAIQTL